MYRVFDLVSEHCFRAFAPDDFPSQFRKMQALALGRVVESCIDLRGKRMTTGTVKFFDQNKGYGFIEVPGGQADVFVHISALEQAGMQTLTQGQKITFDVVKDNRNGKSAAANVQVA